MQVIKEKNIITRREFIKQSALLSGAMVGGTILAGCGATPTPTTAPTAAPTAAPAAQATSARQIIMANAKGMVIADSSRCTGCRRCELACTEFNEGRSQPELSRIKVARNVNFGPKGAQMGFWRGEGLYGNFRVIQDTCRQCAHPVPCELACPHGAIEVVAPTNARVVNVNKCTGCKACQAACPWGMTSFDDQLKKATKCHLCNGDPECVKACPAGALKYVPWEARSRDIPQRWVVPAYISTPADVRDACVQCHK